MLPKALIRGVVVYITQGKVATTQTFYVFKLEEFYSAHIFCRHFLLMVVLLI